LLDIPPKDTRPEDGAHVRNAIVAGNLKSLQAMRPAQLFSSDDLKNISMGNIEDDLGRLADVDWVIEVVVERLDVKRGLMSRLVDVVKDDAIISSNTSGIPIGDIADGLPEQFTRRFLGTHFFNPPRYLRLLEVIPHAGTDADVVEFMLSFGADVLGKGAVLCKDTPNFIGNRFMSMSGMQATNYALDHGYTVEEVDALTGPLIGRPKTATFNLNDLVGFDITMGVARNLYDAIPDDPARDVLNHAKNVELSDALLEKGWLGRKTGKGFYHMRRDGGKKELWALNLETLEYDPPTRPSFDSVNTYRKVEPLGERIKLLMNADDRAGKYLYHLHAFLLAYASNRVPEITDTIVNIDNAQKWGFAHKMGPFEIWDAIGVEATIARFEADGYPVASWVKEMVAGGYATFYQTDDKGKVVGYYSPQAGGYLPLVKDAREITIAGLQASDAQVWSNGDGALYDMGDGVLLWEFTTKANTITLGFLDAGEKAVELLHTEDWRCLVIGNDGERFSAGANLMEMMSGDAENPAAAIDQTIDRLQQLTMKLKYAPKPVVTAVAGQALGGGAEMAMAGDAIVAHIETYIGLVEVGVGVVPAGGGCKELVRRVVTPIARSGVDDVLAPMQMIFENIATAKVAESAKQAKAMGFLATTDRVVMNRAYLLGEAKRHALALTVGYAIPEPEWVYAAGRDVYAALTVAIAGFVEAGYASENDAKVARKIAKILTGGAIAEPTFLPQQVFLDLERAMFNEQVAEPDKNERLMYFIMNGRPMR
jgi:3-hydroxyacyl-CoA dehydrogenase